MRLRVLRRDGWKCIWCRAQPKKEEIRHVSEFIQNPEEACIRSMEEEKRGGWLFSYKKEQRGSHTFFLATVLDESKLHADHITPIALGGDEWDMNNIQTLCEECHKKKTAKDAAKIAQRRRVEELQQKGQTQLTR